MKLLMAMTFAGVISFTSCKKDSANTMDPMSMEIATEEASVRLANSGYQEEITNELISANGQEYYTEGTIEYKSGNEVLAVVNFETNSNENASLIQNGISTEFDLKKKKQGSKYKKVIIVGADKMSSIIDYTDRTTCIIFGDGGGAVLLEPGTEDVGIMDSMLKSDGSGAQHLHMKAGGSRKPASLETIKNREHFVYQEGSSVFKFAVTNMADAAEEVMKRNNLTGDDVAFLVPHQANKRIIDATARRMNVGEDKVMLNIQKYGNTTSGTIPLCLWDYESQLRKGDNLIIAAFGGGFTWGSIWLKWAYDPK